MTKIKSTIIIVISMEVILNKLFTIKLSKQIYLLYKNMLIKYPIRLITRLIMNNFR